MTTKLVMKMRGMGKEGITPASLKIYKIMELVDSLGWKFDYIAFVFEGKKKET